MEVISLERLSKPVQAFLAKARDGSGLVVQDQQGRAFCGVIPYREATPSVQRAALQRLERLHKKVAATMRKRRTTEDDFDRIVQQD